MSVLRIRALMAAACLSLLVVLAPSMVRAIDATTKPEEIYFPINNLHVPVLQNGKAKGALLFNLLIELSSPEDRLWVSKFSPKLKAQFFDELYRLASTIKEDEKVNLAQIKITLTATAKSVAGDKRILGVLIKDFRRSFTR
ncbi:MAG: hypothetical protein O2912_01165 [Proteobacteria bacterium]|nr:hypothetical protein [Pseudomonadota bacterium]